MVDFASFFFFCVGIFCVGVPCDTRVSCSTTNSVFILFFLFSCAANIVQYRVCIFGELSHRLLAKKMASFLLHTFDWSESAAIVRQTLSINITAVVVVGVVRVYISVSIFLRSVCACGLS